MAVWMCSETLFQVELRISVHEIGGRRVAKLLIHSDLFELVIQRVRFAQIVRIAELADEIGRPQQQAFFVFCDRSGSVVDGNRVNSIARAILLASTSLLARMRSITNSFDRST